MLALVVDADDRGVQRVLMGLLLRIEVADGIALLDRAGVADHASLVQQRLDEVFDAYREHAAKLEVDNLVVMDDERGVNGVVNRGPAALVDFLDQLEAGFGIRLRDLIALTEAPEGVEEAAR